MYYLNYCKYVFSFVICLSAVICMNFMEVFSMFVYRFWTLLAGLNIKLLPYMYSDNLFTVFLIYLFG